MKKTETPIDFEINKSHNDIEVSYVDLFEISQGGPVVGSMIINGRKLIGRYGGPVLFDNDDLYAPAQVSKIFGTGFKLAKIDTQTLEVVFLGKIKDLIFLDKIEGGYIYFFEDISKTIYKSYSF